MFFGPESFKRPALSRQLLIFQGGTCYRLLILRYFRLEIYNDGGAILARLWKFLEVQLGGFLKVGDCCFDRRALAHGADLGTLGDVEILFLVDDGS